MTIKVSHLYKTNDGHIVKIICSVSTNSVILPTVYEGKVVGKANGEKLGDDVTQHMSFTFSPEGDSIIDMSSYGGKIAQKRDWERCFDSMDLEEEVIRNYTLGNLLDQAKYSEALKRLNE